MSAMPALRLWGLPCLVSMHTDPTGVALAQWNWHCCNSLQLSALSRWRIETGKPRQQRLCDAATDADGDGAGPVRDPAGRYLLAQCALKLGKLGEAEAALDPDGIYGGVRWPPGPVPLRACPPQMHRPCQGFASRQTHSAAVAACVCHGQPPDVVLLDRHVLCGHLHPIQLVCHCCGCIWGLCV